MGIVGPMIGAALALGLSGSVALAQAPVPDAQRSGAPSGFVPGKDQPTQSTIGGAERRGGGARDRPDGQVAPPSAINSGVQIIAPEKRP